MKQILNIEETHNTREVEEWEREFVEQGSDLEHERWAKWQSYLHSKCVEHSDGKGGWVCFPAELFKRWERQIATRYADLSEDEKESDRKEARTYLPLVHHQLQKARQDIHTSLVAAVEGKKKQIWSEVDEVDYNQALDDILTLLQATLGGEALPTEDNK